MMSMDIVWWLGEEDIETASTTVLTLLIVKQHVLLTLNVKAIPIYQKGLENAMCTQQVIAKVDSHQAIMITLQLSDTTIIKQILNMDVTLSNKVL